MKIYIRQKRDDEPTPPSQQQRQQQQQQQPPREDESEKKQPNKLYVKTRCAHGTRHTLLTIFLLNKVCQKYIIYRKPKLINICFLLTTTTTKTTTGTICFSFCLLQLFHITASSIRAHVFDFPSSSHFHLHLLCKNNHLFHRSTLDLDSPYVSPLLNVFDRVHGTVSPSFRKYLPKHQTSQINVNHKISIATQTGQATRNNNIERIQKYRGTSSLMWIAYARKFNKIENERNKRKIHETKRKIESVFEVSRTFT